jgi:transcriptional regulator with XRE-family HTH domain
MTSDAQKRGKRLRQFILDRWAGTRGISGVADKSGINRDTLYAWFAGQGEPSLDRLEPLAQALGVTRAEIVAAIDGQLPPPNWRADLDGAMREFLASAQAAGVIEVRATPQPSRRTAASGPERRRAVG